MLFFLRARCRPRRSLFNSQKSTNNIIFPQLWKRGGMVVGLDIVPKDPA